MSPAAAALHLLHTALLPANPLATRTPLAPVKALFCCTEYQTARRLEPQPRHVSGSDESQLQCVARAVRRCGDTALTASPWQSLKTASFLAKRRPAGGQRKKLMSQEAEDLLGQANLLYATNKCALLIEGR